MGNGNQSATGAKANRGGDTTPTKNRPTCSHLSQKKGGLESPPFMYPEESLFLSAGYFPGRVLIVSPFAPKTFTEIPPLPSRQCVAQLIHGS